MTVFGGFLHLFIVIMTVITITVIGMAVMIGK
jgi:hypothetical protein